MPLAKYIPLSDNEMLVCPGYCNTKDKIDDFLSLVNLFTSTHSYDLEMNGWIVNLDEAYLLKSKDLELYPGLKEKMSTLITSKAKVIKDYESMGTGMKLPPYDYQKEIIKFILDTGCSLIVSPCGSGKTAIGVGAYIELHNAGKISGPGLIIVKASLKFQWASEVRKFSDLCPRIVETYAKSTLREAAIIKRLQNKLDSCSPEEKASLEEDIKQAEKLRERKFKEQFEKADLFIANYETLKDEKVKKQFKKMNIEYLFADEVHYIKDSSTDRSKALCSLNKAKVKIGATATPVQKDPRDIYGLFKFIKPDLFKRKDYFERDYVRFLGGLNYGRVIGAKNEDKLNRVISPYMIMKTKEDVSSQLPSLVVMQRYFDLEPKQKAMSDKLFKELDELHEQEKSFMNLTPEQLNSDPEYNKLSAQIQARQTFAQELTDSELLLSDGDSKMAQKYITGCKDNKLEVMAELVEDIVSSGEKVCIFSRYARMQEIISDRLRKEKWFDGFNIAYVNGSLSAEKRHEEVYDKFRDDSSYKVLIMSDAGCEGVNLSQCKYLIEMEPAESYAIQTQRHGRLERADSVHDTVFVYQLIANGTWDEIGLKIVNKKAKYDNRIVKGIFEDENK